MTLILITFLLRENAKEKSIFKKWYFVFYLCIYDKVLSNNNDKANCTYEVRCLVRKRNKCYLSRIE